MTTYRIRTLERPARYVTIKPNGDTGWCAGPHNAATFTPPEARATHAALTAAGHMVTKEVILCP